MKNFEAILNVFSKEVFPKESVVASKHITTAISNLFIFNNKVYKIYKQDADFFNKNFYDLSDKAKRFEFTRSDFEWNKSLCKEVYLELLGASWVYDKLVISEPSDDVDELVIVMNKIDMDEGIFLRLLNKSLSVTDCYEIGFQLGKQISLLPYTSNNETNLYKDFIVRHKDVVEWLPIAGELLSKEETGQYCNFLLKFIEDHKSGLEKANEMFGIGIDMHSENALFTAEGKLLTIDTYPPKEDWRRGYKHIGIYRLATDIFALSGEERFRSTLQGYADATGEVFDKEYESFLVMYSALIMIPYLYMLGEKDELRYKGALEYHDFLKSYFKSIF